MARLRRLLLYAMVALALVSGCKVPLTNINAIFTIADVSYFQEEETLFVFYDLEAEQGIGSESIIEIQYTTDDGVQTWTDVALIDAVHTHEDVDCGFGRLCGSTSLHVPLEPRDVSLRLRYHRDGELSLNSFTVYNFIGPGPVHLNRSALVYGVFDAANTGIQWRLRHRFPTIRNEEAQRLGLRRFFRVENQRFGTAAIANSANPYGYGVGCSAGFSGLDLPAVSTEERAVFNAGELVDGAASAALVCGQATVRDATGDFVTDAIAQKNPEVRPAFPVLRSPVRDAEAIKYLLQICDRSISGTHLDMQRQRLLLGDIEPICIDDWMNENFAASLSARLRTDIEQTRTLGRDMVLALALHHDTPEIAGVVESVLSQVLSAERRRRTPRVAGAFVLDSYTFGVTDPEASATVIWCPALSPLEGSDDESDDEQGPQGGAEAATTPGGFLAAFEAALNGDEPDFEFLEVTNLASLVCALGESSPNARLGPLQFNELPVFPSRVRFLDFINSFSASQAGQMRRLKFRVPELPPSSTHVDLAPGVVVTLLNDEIITAESTHAFSFCESGEALPVFFRADVLDELIPIQALPEFHGFLPQSNYALGLLWDFPYVLQLEYQSITAGAISAFSASVPFGISRTTRQNYGSEIWTSETFSLAQSLVQCDRFCDHPTFDAAGVYQINALFRSAYALSCYVPRFPERGDSGFPDDP